MADKQKRSPVLNSPDSSNVGAADTADGEQDRRSGLKDQARADDLALKMSTADELSGYEKVAGRGLPQD